LHKRVLLKDHVIIQFSGCYQGSEFDDALLAMAKTLGPLRLAVKGIISDMSAIEDITLEDTDTARRLWFFRELGKLYVDHEAGLEGFMSSLVLRRIEPKDQRCREIWWQRLARMDTQSIKNPPYEIYQTLHAALAGLELMPAEVDAALHQAETFG